MFDPSRVWGHGGVKALILGESPPRIAQTRESHHLAQVPVLISPGEIPQVPVDQSAPLLRFTDVDQITLNRVVQSLGAAVAQHAHDLTLEQSTVRPADLATAALLVDQQPAA